MTVFTDLETLLTGLGYKVFATKKLDTVKTAIVYSSISQRIVGSMSGRSDMKIERVQVSCYAITNATLKAMELAVENTLSFYDSSNLTIFPTENKVEGFDEATSTFFIHRDYFVQYKE